MWCLTEDEAIAWSRAVGLTVQATGSRIRPAAKHGVTVPLSDLKWARLAWFSTFVASTVQPFDECLLWITLSGVWSSSENWNLFYRLRESYGERRPLEQAPGHRFLAHEAVDLATFIGVALLSGWDFYVIPNLGYATVFVSHDGFLHLYTDDEKAVVATRETLKDAGIECTVEPGP